jgi:hypothetical protein
MKSLLIFTFVIASILVVGAQQSPQIIIGKVLSANADPIPFVHITLNSDRSIGTYTDSKGRFELRLPNLISDSIVFTCIGYEDIKRSLPATMDSLQVNLIQKTYVLPELVISTDTALAILKKAVGHLKYNLADNKNILQGFFREIVRSNTTYDRLVEAAVDIFDNGYNPASGNKELQFRIREMRKSEDYMDLDWMGAIFNYLDSGNGLHSRSNSLFSHDYIRNNAARFAKDNGPLNDAFFEYASFTLDSVIQYRGERVLSIGIKPNKVSNGAVMSPSGKIYIRERDFAIFQLEFTATINKTDLDFLAVRGENIARSVLIKYQEFNNKMYLSMLYMKAYTFKINVTKFFKTDGKEGFLFDEKLFIVNEIITEKDKLQKFRKKEQQKKNMDLYSERWKYTPAFWETYNVVNENPLQPNVKRDLEREVSLEQQFIKND